MNGSGYLGLKSYKWWFFMFIVTGSPRISISSGYICKELDLSMKYTQSLKDLKLIFFNSCLIQHKDQRIDACAVQVFLWGTEREAPSMGIYRHACKCPLLDFCPHIISVISPEACRTQQRLEIPASREDFIWNLLRRLLSGACNHVFQKRLSRILGLGKPRHLECRRL